MTEKIHPKQNTNAIACIILPTYNEVENIPLIIPAIFDLQKEISTHTLYILVVDDNSPDGTQECVKELMGKFPNLYLISGEKKGLGEAYKRGMKYSIDQFNPDLIFEMDADLQHDPNLIPIFISLANHRFSLVIGSRFAIGGSTPDFSLRRKLMSLVGNWMIRFLGGLPGIHDCTSGYRCIKASLITKCDFSHLSTRGYSFQSSLLCELLRQGAKVVEIPIIFPDRIHGNSKLSIKDQIEFLLNIPRIRFRKSSAFIKFCIVGVSGVIINMGIYFLLTRKFDFHLGIASPIAIECSILTNFMLNFFWESAVEKQLKPAFKRAIQFHMVSSLGSVINFIVLLVLVKFFFLWDLMSNLIGIGFATMINYHMNSLLTWKKNLLTKDA